MHDASDASLVVAIGRYRQDALAEAFRRHAGAVFGLARRLLGDEILEALTAVRRYELDTYGGQDVEAVAEKLRYAWSA